jgi:tetratricopeptide (TPR) repeat protein
MIMNSNCFAGAMHFYRMRQLPEAEAACRRMLALEPQHADALHLMGKMACEAGYHELAVGFVGKAIASKDTDACFHSTLGNAFRELSQFEKAAACQRRALALDPRCAVAHYELGSAFYQRGDAATAMECFRRVFALQPDLAGARHHHRMGWLREPEAVCRQILAIDPQNVDALHLLGVIAHEAGQYTIAVGFITKAISLRSSDASLYNSLGRAYRRLGKYDDAAESQRRALLLDPLFVDAYSDLGSVRYRRNDVTGAVASFRRALEIDPNHARTHFRLSRALLLLGDFAAGWAEYEWRWPAANFNSPMSASLYRQWRGEPLEGARILIQAEQGFGDTLQFVRYVPMVTERGGRVVLEVQPALGRLLSHFQGVDVVIPRGSDLPDFAWQCPLLSLPCVFGTELATIPAHIPYLEIQPSAARAWAARISGAGLRVGVVWSGDATHKWDRYRSLRQLAMLAPLAGVDGVTFFSLQKGPPSAQAADPPAGMRLVDLSPQIDDFADTAAAISQLDLVITTCTSVAHLAGALGKRVWILLSYVADWIWLMGREDSPWYPTARLFRQRAPDEWSPVIERVTEELRSLVAAGDRSVHHTHNVDLGKGGATHSATHGASPNLLD